MKLKQYSSRFFYYWTNARRGCRSSETKAAELRKEARNVDERLSQRILKSRENKQNDEKYKINGSAFL